jgi:hypothetical protein
VNAVVTKLLDAAAAVATPLHLAAFAIVALILIAWAARSKRPVPIALSLVAIAALVTLALVPVFVRTHDVYRVRVTVVDPKGVPVEDAVVWSSLGGEPKKVAGGWQFDVPESIVPSDRKFVAYAAVKSAFLSGRQTAELRNDYSPPVVVPLAPDVSARIRGVVVDESGRGVAGVRVTVVGHDQEAVRTSEGGGFDLPAHAADGQQVYLHAEKEGYLGVSLFHPAGNAPARIELVRAENRRR